MQTLREMAEEFAEEMGKHNRAMPPAAARVYWKMVAHLEAEERVRETMGTKVVEHGDALHMLSKHILGDPEKPEESPGVVRELAMIRKGSKANRKLLWYAATVLTGCVVKYGFDLVMHAK